MAKAFKFEDYNISEVTGFAAELPASLPDYFKPWHELADKTVNLVAAQTMREHTLKLPQLDSTKLTNHLDLRLAHLQLSIITAGYVWEQGPMNAPKSLPACIAVPLCDVSDRLGTLASMNYSDYLANWTWIDKTKPLSRDNIKVKYMAQGGNQFVAFQLIGINMELAFAKMLPVIKDVLEGSTTKDFAKVTAGLKALSQYVREITVLAKEFHQTIQPEVFFHMVTSFLRGFNEKSLLPDGMLYEGVKDNPKRKIKDSAASQSAIFQLIDTILQVDYPPEKQQYFQSQREHWVTKHREFFQLLQNWPGNARDMAHCGKSPELKQAYDDLVQAVTQFRTYHLQLVTKYVLLPFKKVKAQMNDTGPDPMASFMQMLKSIRDTAGSSKLQT